MSGKALKLLWAVCLIVDGVCAVIMGAKLPKTLIPVLSIFLLFAIAGTFILTAQLMKRQKKK